jgi:CopG family nickel-responsive transcriptional regulator
VLRETVVNRFSAVRTKSSATVRLVRLGNGFDRAERRRWGCSVADVVRFGISADERLLERFDALIAEKGYVNRSEAVRDLIRSALVERQWESGDEETVGTVTLVYDHHASDLAERLTDHEEIISTLHIHLDAHHCLEVVVLRGQAREISRLASALIGTKGVKHGKFVATTTGQGVV